MMRYTRFDFGAACAVGLLLGLVGCGGEDESAERSPAEAGSAEVGAETLTEEEAAMLAEFRASRDAAGDAGEADYHSKAAPGESDHDKVIASIKGEPVNAVPYDFDRAGSNAPLPVAPAASAPAGNASATVEARGTTVDPPKPAATQHATAPSGNTPTVFRKHEVTDPKYGIVASSMLYPETWKADGGITRGSDQLWFNPIFLDLKFVAPDGRRLHFFPAMSFEFSAQAMQQGAQPFQIALNGNIYHPLPESPGKWIMGMIRQQPDPEITNVRLVSEEPEPQMTRQLKQQAAGMYQSTQQMNQTIASMGMGRAFDTEATVVKLHYTHNNIQIEESILVAWQYQLQTLHGQITHVNWSVPLMVSLGGPVGSDYGNDPELLTILQSVRVNPQWQQKMNVYWQELAAILRRGQEQRNRDWQAHNAKMQKYREDTNAIIAGGYANRSAMREAGFEKQIDGVREVTPYEIGGQTVKIPDYYDNVHTDGTGRYILSNDFNYNPNRDLNLPGNWTKVEPAR